MLAKKNRVRKKKDFERILKGGEGFKEDFLILKVKKNKSNKIRFGFIVAQKVSKKAVVRNKIKRRLREIVRLKMEEIKKGTEGVFITLPGIETRDFREIESIVEKLFKKAGVLNL
ncbi:MAG: ribonuclease P protein component [Candidatus Nealsonbacteria bacterium]